MKKKIFAVSILLLLSFSVYNFYKPGTESGSVISPPPAPYPNHNIWDKFILGAMDEENGDYQHGYVQTDELQFNISHAYSGEEWNTTDHRYYPCNRTPNDHLFTSVIDYRKEVTDYLKDIYYNHNHRRSITQRPKIVWLCYGQSSVYEAEPIPLNNDLWFYSYNHNDVGIQETDNTGGVTRKVMHCRTFPTNQTTDNPGFVVRGLKSNTEQCNPGNNFDADVNCDWFVKPNIRADQSFVSNPANQDVNICRVDVYNHNGYNPGDPNANRVKSVDIKAGNFYNPYHPYNGRYMSEFYFPENPNDTSAVTFPGNLGTDFWFASRGTNPTDSGLTNRTDYIIYWYGACDMWLDYVKVENDVANDLLATSPTTNHLLYDQWIRDEVEQIAFNGNPTAEPLLLKFYIELSEFNHLPCMAYVNQKLKQYSLAFSGGNYSVDLMADFTPGTNFCHVAWQQQYTLMGDPEWIYRNYVQKVGLTQFFAESYPLTSVFEPPPFSLTWSRIPSTLPSASVDPSHILAQRISPANYDTWLQDELNRAPYVFETNVPLNGNYNENECGYLAEDAGMYRYVMKIGSQISKNHNIPFIFMPLGDLWYLHTEVRREPTNEELDMMTNVAVSYGAKGLQWFWYNSLNGASPCLPLFDPYSRAMVKANGDKETYNAYGQGPSNGERNKWEVIRDISVRMKTWQTYLLNFDYAGTHSYTYNTASERNDLLNNSYFNDILTYAPEITNPNNPESTPEPVASRYLQASVFKNINEPRSEYFMLVNRRCSPYRPDINENGGRRDIQIKLKANSNWPTFSNFTNWKIVDLGSGQEFTPFVSSSPGTIDLGWYNPGEGRLYKIVPVMLEGGTLIADENIYSEPQFTIKGVVNNNSHNITIGANNDITFTGHGHIEMQYGSLQIGDINSPQHTLTLTGDEYYIPGPFISCSYTNSLKIFNTDFNSNANAGYYVGLANNKSTVIQGCNFECPDYTGAIGAFYVYSSYPKGFAFSVQNNVFHTNTNQFPALYIDFAGGVQLPVNCAYNTFTSDNSNSASAITLCNVSGGVIRNNHINNYQSGINALQSNIPLLQNIVTASGNAYMGLTAESGTVFDMRNVPGYLLGSNFIASMGNESHNIDVNNSYFLMNNGYNTFNITQNTNCYHMYGTFPAMKDNIDLVISNNCFEQNTNPTNPVDAVTWYNGSNVDFVYQSSSCNINIGASALITNDLGSGVYDTISLSGGHPANAYDSLGYEMRKREYPNVIDIAKRILENSPDSIYSLDAVSKLFAASTANDTSAAGVTALSDYLSTLIINNHANASLVSSCNYFIQKCKVLLHEYSSALTGFALIIEQNPYSYEALVAHWDYMATHLLDSLSGGGEMGDGDDHRGKLTKEQKQLVNLTVKTAFENTRSNEETIIDKLNENARNGDNNAKRLLEQKKTLREVVRPRTPHNIFEHIKIINDDIKKVFGSKVTASNNKNNTIPTVFKLYQNFPNPFNPSATIKYDLPKDVKVLIRVYDILGREVKKLVDEFKKAGSYEINFNGTNLASGVYFYRIEAGTFVEAKKMVLVK
jgi:hypothetical protein